MRLGENKKPAEAGLDLYYFALTQACEAYFDSHRSSIISTAHVAIYPYRTAALGAVSRLLWLGVIGD